MKHWRFGGSENEVKALNILVEAGIKTATSSIYRDYKPEIGEQSILNDFRDHPLGIITITGVQVVPFEGFTHEMALEEGEGNKSLKYWKSVHTKFFADSLNIPEKDFDPKTLILFESFKFEKLTKKQLGKLK